MDQVGLGQAVDHGQLGSADLETGELLPHEAVHQQQRGHRVGIDRQQAPPPAAQGLGLDPRPEAEVDGETPSSVTCVAQHGGRIAFLSEDIGREVIGGREKRAIRIVDHDPAWLSRFEELRDRVEGALGERAMLIEHIGSTSVPGLTAETADLSTCSDRVAP